MGPHVETQSGRQTWEKKLVIKRSFDAPRELVFKAFTDPKLVPQWWEPKIYKTTVDKMNVRPGGNWRFVHRDPSGNEFGFHGVYYDVTFPERLVYTFEFEPMARHILLETIRFEAQDGKTRLIDQSMFQSVEDRVGMLSQRWRRARPRAWIALTSV